MFDVCSPVGGFSSGGVAYASSRPSLPSQSPLRASSHTRLRRSAEQPAHSALASSLLLADFSVKPAAFQLLLHNLWTENLVEKIEKNLVPECVLAFQVSAENGAPSLRKKYYTGQPGEFSPRPAACREIALASA